MNMAFERIAVALIFAWMRRSLSERQSRRANSTLVRNGQSRINQCRYAPLIGLSVVENINGRPGTDNWQNQETIHGTFKL
jgi:hypothetical protein